jgi:hypothetical protein
MSSFRKGIAFAICWCLWYGAGIKGDGVAQRAKPPDQALILSS